MTNEQIEQLGEGMKNLIAGKMAGKPESMTMIGQSVLTGYNRGVDDMVRAFKKAMECEKETH